MSVSELSQDVRSRVVQCPTLKCEDMTVEQFIESDYSCPHCNSDLVLKVVDDVVIPMRSLGGESGYIDFVRIPETPRARRERFKTDHDLGHEMSDKLTTSQEVADFYEDVAEYTDTRTAATFVVDTLLGELHYRDMGIGNVEPDEVYELVDSVSKDEVTWRVATSIIREALDDGRDIDEVFAEQDVGKTDEDELRDIVSSIVEEEESAVQDYLDGQDEAINHLVGRVMQETGGQADAQVARQMLIEVAEEQ